MPMTDISTVGLSSRFISYDNKEDIYNQTTIQTDIEQLIEESLSKAIEKPHKETESKILYSELSDIEEFAKIYSLDRINDPEFLFKDIEEKRESNPFDPTSPPLSDKADVFWEPFKASDHLLDEVIASTVEESEDLLSLLDNSRHQNIHSSPGGIYSDPLLFSNRIQTISQQTPLRGTSSNNQIYRHALSSPADGPCTVSFSIKSGRIISASDRNIDDNTNESNVITGAIFKTPSSKRRLDFYSNNSEKKNSSIKGPSRIFIGSAEEGILVLPSDKENRPPFSSRVISSPEELLHSPKSPLFSGTESGFKPKVATTLSSLSSVSLTSYMSSPIPVNLISSNKVIPACSFVDNNSCKFSNQNPLFNSITITNNLLQGPPSNNSTFMSSQSTRTNTLKFKTSSFTNSLASKSLRNTSVSKTLENINASTIEQLSDYSYLSASESSQEDNNELQEFCEGNNNELREIVNEEGVDENDPINIDYQNFIKSLFDDSTSIISPGDEDEDPEDSVYEAEADIQVPLEHISIKKRAKILPKSNNNRLCYRIKERELSGLIADCHMIIASDSINSPFQKIKFSSEETITTSSPTISTSSGTTSRLALLLKAHTQLLFQQFILCSTIVGDPDAASIARTVYFMLSELKLQADRSWSLVGRELLTSITPINEQQQQQQNFSSVFIIPCLERLPILRPTLDRLGLMSSTFMLENTPQSASPLKETRELPSTMNTLFALFKDFFLEKWKPIPFKPSK